MKKEKKALLAAGLIFLVSCSSQKQVLSSEFETFSDEKVKFMYDTDPRFRQFVQDDLKSAFADTPQVADQLLTDNFDPSKSFEVDSFGVVHREGDMSAQLALGRVGARPEEVKWKSGTKEIINHATAGCYFGNVTLKAFAKISAPKSGPYSYSETSNTSAGWANTSVDVNANVLNYGKGYYYWGVRSNGTCEGVTGTDSVYGSFYVY